MKDDGQTIQRTFLVISKQFIHLETTVCDVSCDVSLRRFKSPKQEHCKINLSINFGDDEKRLVPLMMTTVQRGLTIGATEKLHRVKTDRLPTDG